MNFKVVSDWVKKQAIYFDTIVQLHAFRPEPQDELPAAEWVVLVNWGEEGFQFDWEKFFLYENNKIEHNKEIELHAKEQAKLEKEGKTTEEIRKYFEGKGTRYIDRVEYKLFKKGTSGLVSIADDVNKLIKSIS